MKRTDKVFSVLPRIFTSEQFIHRMKTEQGQELTLCEANQLLLSIVRQYAIGDNLNHMWDKYLPGRPELSVKVRKHAACKLALDIFRTRNACRFQD